jgi:hypothetical protein
MFSKNMLNSFFNFFFEFNVSPPPELPTQFKIEMLSEKRRPQETVVVFVRIYIYSGVRQVDKSGDTVFQVAEQYGERRNFANLV